ncbi:hypothetical protein GLOTRDRAFT_134596 [Gloeophyllum trabeum ATCC 11539]|uniref:Uncharacterized protein n=1 Tax=Gloeophyllum trabeum (strain ATCC 11539 / FP-39264 / Madison 617) TaxID=670483 RepID=S7R5Z3_GLOTA|nr:uncharacterized protein GLOTRDRAFT_134596 [Gloeophyllum trabeum ATCC 11539]EPQ49800.1 hypothetical protein GLOTRDRAFT_134596 [Gloeophyllum trabeum ATCC 11539]
MSGSASAHPSSGSVGPADDGASPGPAAPGTSPVPGDSEVGPASAEASSAPPPPLPAITPPPLPPASPPPHAPTPPPLHAPTPPPAPPAPTPPPPAPTPPPPAPTPPPPAPDPDAPDAPCFGLSSKKRKERQEPPAAVRSVLIKPKPSRQNAKTLEMSEAVASAHKEKIAKHFAVLDTTADEDKYPTVKKARGNPAIQHHADEINRRASIVVVSNRERKEVCSHCTFSVASPVNGPDPLVLLRPGPTIQVGRYVDVQYTGMHWRCMTHDARARFYKKEDIPPQYAPGQKKKKGMTKAKLQHLDVSRLSAAKVRWVLADIKKCHSGEADHPACLLLEETDELLEAKADTKRENRAEYRKARSMLQKEKRAGNKVQRLANKRAKKHARWLKRSGMDEMEVDEDDRGEGSSKVQDRVQEDSTTEESEDDTLGPESEDE